MGADSKRASELARAARAEKEASERLRVLVALAREQGMSWGEIGEAIGVTRQSAHRRFTS